MGLASRARPFPDEHVEHSEHENPKIPNHKGSAEVVIVTPNVAKHCRKDLPPNPLPVLYQLDSAESTGTEQIN